MYLVFKELGVSRLDVLFRKTVGLETRDFVCICIDQLKHKCSRLTELYQILQTHLNSPINTLKREIERLLQKDPPSSSTLRWIFNLELSERGERIERWFFEQLSSRDVLLQNFVILQSVKFLTNVKQNKHREFDLVLISLERKLIIGIEMKRHLITERAFTQLSNYHSTLEERLGDQLGAGWTFFPVICVEHDIHSYQSLHYISMKTDLDGWLTSIKKAFPPIPSQNSALPLYHLRNILQIIVFSVHVSTNRQIAPITSSNYICHNITDTYSII